MLSLTGVGALDAALTVLPPVGLLGFLAMWLILTGRLIPKYVYKEFVPRAVYDEMVRERDHWRTLSEVVSAQNRELLVGAEVARDVLTSLPIQEREGESANEVPPS